MITLKLINRIIICKQPSAAISPPSIALTVAFAQINVVTRLVFHLFLHLTLLQLLHDAASKRGEALIHVFCGLGRGFEELHVFVLSEGLRDLSRDLLLAAHV